MSTINPKELAALLQSTTEIQLIDVREMYEHNAFNIGGELMPLPGVVKRIDEIKKDVPVIFYCRVGVRSQIAIQRLQAKYPFKNLINLVGGMEAWKKEFAV